MRTELPPIEAVVDRYGWSNHLWSSYDALIGSFGYEILLQVDDDDYQGDSRILFRDRKRYGYLLFGWGSCSGFDALQACETLQEFDDIRYGLYDGIQWFTNAQEALAFFTEHDWEGDYGFHREEQMEFINRAKDLLEIVLLREQRKGTDGNS